MSLPDEKIIQVSVSDWKLITPDEEIVFDMIQSEEISYDCAGICYVSLQSAHEQHLLESLKHIKSGFVLERTALYHGFDTNKKYRLTERFEVMRLDNFTINGSCEEGASLSFMCRRF